MESGIMNKEEVIELIKKVKEHEDDTEEAHCLADSAYISVLEAIAEGTCDEPQICAKLILTIEDMDFNRWYV